MFAGIAVQFLAPRFIQPPPPAVWLYPLIGIVGGFALGLFIQRLKQSADT
jgi:hypothetical protein